MRAAFARCVCGGSVTQRLVSPALSSPVAAQVVRCGGRLIPIPSRMDHLLPSFLPQVVRCGDAAALCVVLHGELDVKLGDDTVYTVRAGEWIGAMARVPTRSRVPTLVLLPVPVFLPLCAYTWPILVCVWGVC